MVASLTDLGLPSLCGGNTMNSNMGAYMMLDQFCKLCGETHHSSCHASRYHLDQTGFRYSHWYMRFH